MAIAPRSERGRMRTILKSEEITRQFRSIGGRTSTMRPAAVSTPQQCYMPMIPVDADGRRAANSKAAVSELLCRETKVRAGFNEVDIQALVSPAEFSHAYALEIFEIDAPTPFARRIGGEVVLGAGRPSANPSDIVADVRR